MERITNSLSADTTKKLEAIYLSKKMDPKFAKMISSLKLSDDEVRRNLSSLEDSLEELENCKNCPGLANCPNHLKGHVYYPDKKESKVSFNYVPCKKKKSFDKAMDEKDSNYILENARMKDIDVTDKTRVKLIKWLKSFYDKYDASKENKGLYLHGTFGSGKTFLLAALLNELSIAKDAKFEIVYFPELLRTLKDNFNMLDSKVRYYSNVEILLIDDIGAEKVTDWGRDEILGTILQARMNKNKTTFFTSNLTIDELEKHLSLSKDSEDTVKARRIIERIKQLTVDEELIAMNRRN